MTSCLLAKAHPRVLCERCTDTLCPMRARALLGLHAPARAPLALALAVPMPPPCHRCPGLAPHSDHVRCHVRPRRRYYWHAPPKRAPMLTCKRAAPA